jgi:serine transporter
MDYVTNSTGVAAEGSGWSRHDTMWVLGIYGCAVGGGSLFWPVSLGLHGFWPMVILSLLAFPITYFPYVALARYVLAGSSRDGHDGNVLDTTIEFLGKNWGKFLTTTYFLTVFPGMMIYTITITNTIIDFSRTQLHYDGLSRWVVAPICVAALMLIVRYGTNVVVRAMGFIVAPFIVSIVVFGVMAAPHWNSAMLATMTNFGGASGLALNVWKGLPLCVFAFSFTSITSSFVVAQKKHYGPRAVRKVPQIMFVATLLAVSTMLFFSWSCIFALSPAELAQVKASNLTVLSFLARKFDTPAISIASQLIVFTAVIKSFLAHYLATEESARSFGRTLFGLSERTLHGANFRRLIVGSVFLVTTTSAIFNLDVVDIITVALVPVSVFIVYFLPLYAFQKIDTLKKYRGRPTNLLVFTVGVVCLVSGVIAVAGKVIH